MYQKWLKKVTSHQSVEFLSEDRKNQITRILKNLCIANLISLALLTLALFIRQSKFQNWILFFSGIAFVIFLTYRFAWRVRYKPTKTGKIKLGWITKTCLVICMPIILVVFMSMQYQYEDVQNISSPQKQVLTIALRLGMTIWIYILLLLGLADGKTPRKELEGGIVSIKHVPGSAIAVENGPKRSRRWIKILVGSVVLSSLWIYWYLFTTEDIIRLPKTTSVEDASDPLWKNALKIRDRTRYYRPGQIDTEEKTLTKGGKLFTCKETKMRYSVGENNMVVNELLLNTFNGKPGALGEKEMKKDLDAYLESGLDSFKDLRGLKKNQSDTTINDKTCIGFDFISKSTNRKKNYIFQGTYWVQTVTCIPVKLKYRFSPKNKRLKDFISEIDYFYNPTAELDSIKKVSQYWLTVFVQQKHVETICEKDFWNCEAYLKR